jgi:hypothetical protein
MILVVLFIGAILLVSALRGTYAALFSDLGTDVPQFVVWAAAILALGSIGFIPGLRPISRGLMALVLVVIILQNYKNILTGFQAVSTAPSSTTSTPSSGSGTGATNIGITVSTPDGSSATGTLQTVPNYSALDYVTPPSAFSSGEIGEY